MWYCGELFRGWCGCGNGNVAINLARVCADDMAVQVSRQFYGECGFAASGGTGDDDGGATGWAYVSAMVLCNDTGYLDDDFCGFFHGGDRYVFVTSVEVEAAGKYVGAWQAFE